MQPDSATLRPRGDLESFVLPTLAGLRFRIDWTSPGITNGGRASAVVTYDPKTSVGDDQPHSYTATVATEQKNVWHISAQFPPF